MSESWFPFGGQYVPVVKAPEVPVSDWERDIRQLKELGFTAFRAFVAWDRIERQEGVRDYAMLDTALDLAARHQVKVLVSLGGVFENLCGLYPPQWLFRDHGCQQPIRDAAAPATAPRPSGPRQSVCLDDPFFRARAGDFMTETIRRYAPHPALGGWVVWNEPANNPCYCPHTKARFRDWLMRCYQDDLDALVRAWSLEFPVLYRAWDEVEPPSGVGFLHGGYQPWLDWRRFLTDNLTESLGWIADLIRANDPVGHPTSVNLTPGELAGQAVSKGLNIWDLGRVLERPGMSAYTLWDTSQPEPADMAVRFARMRSVVQAPGRPWWVVETEAGPVYWVHGMVPRYTRTPDRLLRYWQAIGHGAEACYGWMYRSRIGNAQAGEFGMLAWDGSVTERAAATGQLSRLVNRHAELFQTRYPRAEVAILAAHSSDLLYRAETWEARPETFRNYWQRSWGGAYRMLWRQRVPAEFVDDSHVVEGRLDYRVLLVPFHLNLSEPVARGLEAFVERGGTIVADFPFGFKDDSGMLWQRSPGAGLAALVGGWANDALPCEPDEDQLEIGAERLAPFDFRQAFELLEGAEVLGRWRDGSAGLLSRRSGAGRALLVGTLFFAGADGEQGPLRQRLLNDWLAEAGVRPVAEVEPRAGSSLQAAARVEVCPLHPLGEGESLWVILNHNAEAVSLTVRLPVRSGALRDLVADRSLAVTAAGDQLGLDLELAAKEVAVVAG